MMKAFRRAWDEVAKEEGVRDEFFRTVLDDLEKFRAGHPSPAPSSASSAP
jgi:hypothetical protein